MFSNLPLKPPPERLVIVPLLFLIFSALFSAPLYGGYSREGFTLGEGISGRIEKRVPLSVFPHWLHSMWYTCRACHDKVFPMESLPSGSVMEKIDRGELCGVCHNGDISFETKKNCRRCHQSRETAAMVMFSDPHGVSIDELDKVFKRLEIEWFPEKLKNRALFFDITEHVDFSRMILKEQVIRPRGFIKEKRVGRVRDNRIIFNPKSDFMYKVIFDHTIHSGLISCESCHEKVFVSKLDGNTVFMKDIAGGKYCGMCHNGIAFSIDNCKKCHKKGVKKKSERVLLRK